MTSNQNSSPITGYGETVNHERKPLVFIIAYWGLLRPDTEISPLGPLTNAQTEKQLLLMWTWQWLETKASQGERESLRYGTRGLATLQSSRVQQEDTGNKVPNVDFRSGICILPREQQRNEARILWSESGIKGQLGLHCSPVRSDLNTEEEPRTLYLAIPINGLHKHMEFCRPSLADSLKNAPAQE